MASLCELCFSTGLIAAETVKDEETWNNTSIKATVCYNHANNALAKKTAAQMTQETGLPVELVEATIAHE